MAVLRAHLICGMSAFSVSPPPGSCATPQVSSLQNENAALHSRTSILEKVLDMRNEQIQVMQETKEVRRTRRFCNL